MWSGGETRWSVVGNIGQMLGVANEVRITCHPFTLETLFRDPLLTLNPYAQKSIGGYGRNW